MIDTELFRGQFDTIEESSSAKEYRKKMLSDVALKMEFPKYRYSSFINMRLPQVDVTTIPPLPDATITVEASSNVTVSRQLTDDHIPRIVSQFQPESPLDVFHDAFRNTVLVIEIPDSAQEKITLSLTARDDILIQSIYVVAGKNSSSSITIKRACSGNASFISSRIYSLVEDGAHLELFGAQNYPSTLVALEKEVVLAEKDSIVKTTELCLGSRYAKYDSYVRLMGEGAHSEMTVLYLTKNQQKHNIHTESDHHASSTYSNIITKGVIADKAKSLCTGNVCIREQASHANGYETQNALLLSDTAEADAIPNLEIHNHDVKCSHGSTVGQLDKKQLFYLQSRGVPELKAKELIVQGYFNPILEKINSDSLRDIVYSTLWETIYGTRN